MYDNLSLKIVPKKLPPTGNFRWVTNLYKNEIYDSDIRFAYNWLAEKYVGKPHPSNVYTVEQMEEMGMVGIYVEDECI